MLHLCVGVCVNVHMCVVCMCYKTEIKEKEVINLRGNMGPLQGFEGREGKRMV